ncbi:granzyme B(G,H)-like isoform X1 [Serinus canaria]|uniref:granzyme B(G,H)-like isoform X1 n=1 Tax=Serinus canaria TaxID=9135 RepID=UPI0021CD16B0|nr:granzyme B(G,H)-like isoform X1 [Serinus canaria]
MSVLGDRNAHRGLQGQGSSHGLELLLLLLEQGSSVSLRCFPLCSGWGSSHLCQCGVRDPQLSSGRNPGERGKLAESSYGEISPTTTSLQAPAWGLCSCQCSWNVLVFPGRTVRVTVILGAHNIRGQEQSQQKIPVGRWIIHPEYCPDNFKNDIVLLKLKKKARINKNVRCISIPRRNESVEEGDKCNVSGWGWTSDTGNTANVLMEVELEVQNEEICEQFFRNYQRQSMICVGDENRKKATSHGDSGGPLVCNKKAHGIVSHARKRNLFPEVFTRISHFEPWIRKQLRRFGRKVIPCFPFSD